MFEVEKLMKVSDESPYFTYLDVWISFCRIRIHQGRVEE